MLVRKISITVDFNACSAPTKKIEDLLFSIERENAT